MDGRTKRRSLLAWKEIGGEFGSAAGAAKSAHLLSLQSLLSAVCRNCSSSTQTVDQLKYQFTPGKHVQSHGSKVRTCGVDRSSLMRLRHLEYQRNIDRFGIRVSLLNGFFGCQNRPNGRYIKFAKLMAFVGHEAQERICGNRTISDGRRDSLREA